MKKSIVFIVLLMFVFTGCTAELVINGYTPIVNSNVDYQIEKINLETAKIDTPYGMCVFNDEIVVCDFSQNVLVVLDKNGEYVQTVGKIGSGEKEFLQPTAVEVYNKNIYIVDSGNNRVQVLDKNYNYVKEYRLTPLVHHPAGYVYLDIAVEDNGTIYVSTNSVGKHDSRITVIKDDVIEQTKKEFVGYLTQYNGKVYAINSLELFRTGKEEGGESGKNYMYLLDGVNMKKVMQLPDKYTPCDFIVFSQGVAVTSRGGTEIKLFSSDAQESKQIYEFENRSRYMNIANIGEEKLVISLGETKELYIVKIKKGN